MCRLEEIKPKQVLYQRSDDKAAMSWRHGVHRIFVERVILEGKRGVVASWNNREPRFFPEDRVWEWQSKQP